MGSITLKCNSLHYNYLGKMCHYVTLQLLYFVNVINYITITLSKLCIILHITFKERTSLSGEGEGGGGGLVSIT